MHKFFLEIVFSNTFMHSLTNKYLSRLLLNFLCVKKKSFQKFFFRKTKYLVDIKTKIFQKIIMLKVLLLMLHSI